MNCSKCGSYMSDDSKFCGNCGTVFNSAPAFYCPHCNTPLNPGDAFCYACGKSTTPPAAPAYHTPPTPMAPVKKSSDSKAIIIILCIVLAIALIAGAVMSDFDFFGSSKKSSFSSGSNIASNDFIVPVTPPPTPRPTTISAPVFTMADASSIRGTDTEGGTYSVSSVLTTDPLTKWVPSKSNDGGLNEWVKIYSFDDQYVHGVKILNGYHKNSNTWGNNNRVRYCTITLSDGTSRDFTLPDTMDMITLDFGSAVKTSSIKLTITGLYRGTKWNDTAITYLGAY